MGLSDDPMTFPDSVQGPFARHGLRDRCRMEDELKAIFGRNVDLVDRRAVEQSENYIRPRHVLSHLETIHAA